MKRQRLTLGLVLIFVLLLPACNGNVTTTPPPPPRPLTNVAGQYTGTATDSVFGSGSSLGDFSQSGSAVGGRLELTYGSHTVANSVAMVLSRSNSLSGTATATIGRSACTFSVTSNYDSQTFKLTGTYTAAHGCAGETGSFGLTEACFYPQNATSISGNAKPRRRNADKPDAAGLHPC